MKLTVAGGCTEHGRNCFYVEDGDNAFLVDCGIMKEKPETPYPALTKKQIRSARCLFLTHCHADHAGALLWLYESGFRGTVIADAYTLEVIPGMIRGSVTFEELGPPLEKIRMTKGVSFRYGRSGHCIGSVWLEFTLRKHQRILFSGDYCEASLAYRCDPIRGRKAEIAVLDCAYGLEETDASDHRKALIERIKEDRDAGRTMLFPVPLYGRGFDILRILFENRVPVFADQAFLDGMKGLRGDSPWLKEGFRSILPELKVLPLETRVTGRGPCGILVTDSQLNQEGNRAIALSVVEEGGETILTGKQEPTSFSRLLLSSGKAVFCRISVHQNLSEMKKLVKKNSFRRVVPYHCRQELKDQKKKYIMLKAGEGIENE